MAEKIIAMHRSALNGPLQVINFCVQIINRFSHYFNKPYIFLNLLT